MSKKYFVTGIDTGVGKTLVSAFLVKHLDADYWKPIQSGSDEGTDTDFVKKYLNPNRIAFKESICLKASLSPNFAAALENTTIDLNAVEIPSTANNLIIEGAGGLFVPLNNNDTIIDLIQKTNAEVIIVSKHYLGSINHTLLTVFALKKLNIPIAGIIFSGEENADSEKIKLKLSGLQKIAHIPFLSEISESNISETLQKLSINGL
jgi:dethiobiotin synthetase